MIVRCLHSRFRPNGLNPELEHYLFEGMGVAAEREFPLVVGVDYLVAAVSLGPFVPWMFVVDRKHGLRYPISVPSPLLSVRDSRASRVWELGSFTDRANRKHALIAPDFWARDPLYHGRMFEGDEDALQQMERCIASMMLEWPIPWIDQVAVAVGTGNWVSDPAWADSWEADPADAMTTNPKDGALFHNPLFNAAVSAPGG